MSRTLHPTKLISLSCVISFNSLGKRWQRLSICRNHPIIYWCINEAELMIIKMNLFICDVIQDFLSLQKLSQNIQDYSHNATPPAVQMKWFPLSCDIFTPLMKKVRDFVLLQEPSCTWWRHSASINAASQNEVIHLWCNSRLSSHWRITEQDY